MHNDVSSLEYREFSKKLHNNTQNKRIPLDGTFELTFRCNLKCKHCYCNQPVNDKKIKKQELSTEEIFRVFDEISEAGCFWLLISGGEPLLREDFEDIYIYAKRKGMLITLFTNGTLVNTKIAEMLKDYPPFLVEITLYGATAKTYEKITGVQGSFTQCIKGIGKRGIEFGKLLPGKKSSDCLSSKSP